MRASRRATCIVTAIAVLLTLASRLSAASLFDPALRFRTLSTEHFVIHFHQGEDALAQRLAVIAEEAWLVLQQTFGVAPRRTQVVRARTENDGRLVQTREAKRP